MAQNQRDWLLWLVAMLKGGTRKTTTAMLLAFALAKRGYDVCVIDADAGTQGVTDWASRYYAENPDGEIPFDIVQWSHLAGLLVPFIHQAQKNTGARIILVDVGGEQPEVVKQVVRIADQVISPVGPEQAEIGRLYPTKQIIDEAGAPMNVLLTRVPHPRKGVAAEVRADLERDGYVVLRAETGQNRERYAHVWGSVPEDVGEYDDLAVELLTRAGLPLEVVPA